MSRSVLGQIKLPCLQVAATAGGKHRRKPELPAAAAATVQPVSPGGSPLARDQQSVPGMEAASSADGTVYFAGLRAKIGLMHGEVVKVTPHSRTGALQAQIMPLC